MGGWNMGKSFHINKSREVEIGWQWILKEREGSGIYI